MNCHKSSTVYSLPVRTERQKQIQKLEKDIKKLDSRRGGGSDSDSEAERAKRKAKKSHLEEELAKYSKGRGLKGRKDEKVSRKYNTAYAIEQSRVLTWEHQGLENVWGQRQFQSLDDCVLPTCTIPGVANRPLPLVAGEHERRQ